MTHTITATVPMPRYRPRHPVFDHHHSTAPTGSSHPNGERGRVITVMSESLSVAYEVGTILAKVFKHVEVDGEPV